MKVTNEIHVKVLDGINTKVGDNYMLIVENSHSGKGRVTISLGGSLKSPKVTVDACDLTSAINNSTNNPD